MNSKKNVDSQTGTAITSVIFTAPLTLSQPNTITVCLLYVRNIRMEI